MQAQILAWGRVARDGAFKTTQTGKPMGVATIAVNVTRKGAQGASEPWWLNILGFGDRAESVGSARKGEVMGVMGELQRSRQGVADGRSDHWTVVADAVLPPSRLPKPPEAEASDDAAAPPADAVDLSGF